MATVAALPCSALPATTGFHSSNEMMPGEDWAHIHTFLELGNDGYRTTVSTWSFAF